MIVFLKKNWFVVSIILVLCAAFAMPESGRKLNTNGIISTAAVLALFFLSGLSLSFDAIKKGVKDIKLHLFTQLFIFGIIPVYFFLTAFPFEKVLDGRLIIGIYALSCLPTTISSCIIFTQIAGGNVVGTIFNSSLSNLTGIFISPVLLTFFLKETGHPLPPDEILRILQALVLKMIFPFATGQLLHVFVGRFVLAYKKKFSTISSILVLFIVYFAFCKAAGNIAFRSQLKTLAVPFAYLAVSNLILVFLSYTGARLLRFSRENIASVVFAAPQKTLAMGIPLLSAYFADKPEILGIAILPLLFYHVWQLIVAGFVKSLLLIRR